MRALKRFRPSPAMLVASAALLFALAGTSVAAVTALVPRNSVGTAQLQANAVVSSKVKNRSLLGVDFKRGQLPRGERGPQGPPGTGATLALATATGDTATTTTSTSFTALAGASATVTVPTGSTATLVAVFAAESACSGGAGAQWCIARILVDGTEATPSVGTDFAFDSTNNANETAFSWESHAVQRIVRGVAAGSHTVAVEVATTNAATTLRTDDWSLVVQAVKE